MVERWYAVFIWMLILGCATVQAEESRGDSARKKKGDEETRADSERKSADQKQKPEAKKTTHGKNASKPRETALPETVVTVTQENRSQPLLKMKASTATKTDVPLRDIPQSVQIIPRKILDEQGTLNLQETMELNVPGTGFDTANNTKDKFIIRGLSSQIFRDGLREISPPRFNLSDVERVEILKGPASVLYGRSEAGAMINIISKRPVWEPLFHFTMLEKYYSGNRDEGYSSLGGLYDDGVMSMDIGGPIIEDKLAYRLTGYLDDSNGWRNYVHEKARDLSFALEERPSDKVKLTLRTAFYDRDQVTDRGLIGVNGIYPDNPALFYGSQGTVSAINQLLIEPGVEIKINNRMRLRNTFRYTIHDKEEVSLRARRVEDNFIGAFGGTVGSDGIYESVEREQRQIDEKYRWFTEQLELYGNAVTGRVKHNYLVGLESTILKGTRQDFRLRDSGNFSDPLFYTPWLNPDAGVRTIDATIDHPLASGKKDVDFEDKYFGLYLQDQVTFSEQWKLLGGLRFDRYDETLKNPYKTANPDQDVLENVVSWRLGIVYQPIERTSFYALASHGFKPTGGVYSSNIERDDGMDFKPEQNILYEVGNKTRFLDNNLSVILSLYEGTRKNFTTTDPNTGETEQIGEQRTRGMELIVEGLITKAWSIRASCAYTDAQYVTRYKSGVDLSGNTPAFVPQKTARLWTTYDFKGTFKIPLKFGLGTRWIDKRWQEDTNKHTFAAYTVVDVFSEYQFDENASIRLNINNLFNEAYYVSGTGYGDYAMPGDPLSASLALNVTF